MIPYEEIFEGARFAQVEISPVSGEFLNLNSAKILDAVDENEK